MVRLVLCALTTSSFSVEDIMPTTGIITALPKEIAAVKHPLDDCEEKSVPGAGAGRRYVVGTLPSKHGGAHSVVLCLANMGNNIAATRATLLLEHFPTVTSVIMTGIAGGAPHPKVPALHVRLGDIVVSNWKGVIQYDMTELGEINCSPRPPSSQLLDAVRILEQSELLTGRSRFPSTTTGSFAVVCYHMRSKLSELLTHTS